MQNNIKKLLEEFDKKFVQHSHPERFPHFGQSTIIEGIDAEKVKQFVSTSIQQLLVQRDEEIIRGLLKKVESICTFRDYKFDIGGVYGDEVLRGQPQEAIDLINREDVYKILTNSECLYTFNIDDNKKLITNKIKQLGI